MQFETLDVAVQEEFEKYLQERGVNEHVALFIPDYAEYKEQTVCPPTASRYFTSLTACPGICQMVE